MSRKFYLVRDYYEDNKYLYKKRVITIKPGVTVLVGCNGIGKTTLLHQIKEKLRENKIPCVMFNNLHDGGDRAVQEAAFYDDFGFVANAVCSSEGENILMNMSNFASKLRNFVETGKVIERNPFAKIFEKNNEQKENENEEDNSNERWILLDAVDSGLSVDNVIDLKEGLFKTILQYNFGKEIYIVVSANAYEMARNEQCFNVYNGSYRKFKDYEEYRQFVLDSKEWKRNRFRQN